MPRENLTQLIRRVERAMETAIMVAHQRGYSIARGTWIDSDRSTCCAVGAVIAQMYPNIKGEFIDTGATLLNVEPRDLDYFVDGFDDGTDPPPRNKPRNRQFYLLGRRLARRHVHVYA